ncbi:MerR family transcriptional regulator [Streptomyces sp. NPDC059853]|uniref:MerR family transcriptional regulator n=1 Tax=Streptomyces sp. NPDC059853 TaxID=3346973 RepID=UPI0036493C68
MFSIGDFSRYGGVSVRMLRHYDALGLLVPARTDAYSGYRWYEAGQLVRLHRIVALKGLGFSLQQVGEILDERVSGAELRGMLRLRSAELAAALEADTLRLAGVEARLRIIESEGRMPTHDVVVKKIPGLRVAELTAVASGASVAAIGQVAGPLFDRLGDLMAEAGVEATGPGIARYTPAADGDGIVVHAGCQVAVDPGHPGAAAAGLAITDLPPVETAATLVHRGPMTELLPSLQTLAHWIDAHGYRSAGLARELYLDCPPGGDWVTELQEPVTRAPGTAQPAQDLPD